MAQYANKHRTKVEENIHAMTHLATMLLDRLPGTDSRPGLFTIGC